MSGAERFVRRNRVDERHAGAIAVVAGVFAAFAGARPTGSVLVDVSLVVAGVAAVVWAAASAPWWTPTLAAGVGATIALEPLLALVGAVAFALGLFIGIRQRDHGELRALVAAIGMNVLIRSGLDGFVGLSALIGCSLGLMMFVLGVRRRPSATSHVARIVAVSVGGIVVIALLGLAVTAVPARANLSNAAQQAREAISVLNAGDYEEAARLFESSSSAFARSDARLGGMLALPSRLVPVVAQNARAGADLSAAASAGLAEAADALRAIDPASLTVVSGRIDLDAVAAVEEPLLRVREVLEDLQGASDDVSSPWLLAPVQDELADLDERLGSNRPRLDNAIDAVRLAPQMLGADGLRRYLVIFTTPVELRGLAGFIGNYAEITVDDGRVEVSEFGRRSDLEDHLRDNPGNCDACPPEMLDRYGSFGLTNGPNGGVLSNVWQNLPMPAHFPYTAQAAQVLYPQSGGDPIDGVISIDPYVIQALMGYTGAIDVPELGVIVEPGAAAQFILRDQYLLTADDDGIGGVDNESRVDALQTLGEGVIDGLLTGALPEPSQLARDLGPLAVEHRLMVWTDDPDEQQLLDRTGLLGALPALDENGGFSVVVANAGESKIDAYLERATDVRIDVAPDGSRELIADVTLRNGAPSSGLPDLVIGNGFGLPTGSSRLVVNFFGPDTLTSLTIDGQVLSNVPKPESGWTGYRTDVVLAAGESVSYEARFRLEPVEPGEADGDPVQWVQPLATLER
jgi:hypothetical protein